MITVDSRGLSVCEEHGYSHMIVLYDHAVCTKCLTDKVQTLEEKVKTLEKGLETLRQEVRALPIF